jgi:ribosomal-protein-alanine N-acetyltransferase
VILLPVGEVALRAPRRGDGQAWCEVRLRARDHLEPWEVLGPRARSLSWEQRQHPSSWTATVKAARQAQRGGIGRLWVLTLSGALVGMVELNRISRDGPDSQAEVGYWVDPRLHRQGVGSVAVAMACDLAFGELGLNRVQAFVQHANVASTGLLTQLGFQLEGVAREVLWSAGGWQDHELWGLVRSDVQGGVLARSSAGRTQGEQQET